MRSRGSSSGGGGGVGTGISFVRLGCGGPRGSRPCEDRLEPVERPLEPRRPRLEARCARRAGSPPRRSGLVGVEERADRRQRQLEVPERRDRPRRRRAGRAGSGDSPVAGSTSAGCEDALLVVVAEGADRQPGEPGEPTDREELVVHARHPEPSTYPRVKGRPLARRLRRCRARGEIARRMKRAASALLPPSFWPSSCSSATARSASIAPSAGVRCERARRERGLEPGDGAPRVLDRVALRLHPLPERRPCRVGRRARCSPSSASRPGRLARRRHRASTRPPPCPPAPGAARPSAIARACQRVARHSGSSTLMWISSHQRPSRQIASRDATLGHEADPRVGPDRPLVEREHRQRDAVQPERRERVVDHQRRRLAAVAVAPGVVLADRDVEQRRAVVAVELR